MDFSMIFFILVGALSIAAAVGVVTSKVAVHSALFLLVHFATLAVLYITLDAQFLGAAQVIIYAGGIVILILFVIMLIGSDEFDTRANYRSWVPYAGIGLGVVLVGGLAMAFLRTPLSPATLPANGGGTPDQVGMYLYTQGILLVELAAVLLLVALLGALLLARRPQEETPAIELENKQAQTPVQ
jgi:NADH-quinone oxidoreductase subunit J